MYCPFDQQVVTLTSVLSTRRSARVVFHVGMEPNGLTLAPVQLIRGKQVDPGICEHCVCSVIKLPGFLCELAMLLVVAQIVLSR